MGHLPCQPLRGLGRLERRGEEAHDRKPPFPQRRAKCLDRGKIGRDQKGTVEHHEDQGLSGVRSGQNRAGHPVFGRPAPDRGQGLGAPDRAGIETRGQRHLRQRRLRRHRPAGIAQMLQPAQGRHRKRRYPVKARVRAPVRRQYGKGDALLPRKRPDLLNAICPIGHPANQPDQNSPGARERLFDIGIDRKRVFQCGNIGKAQAGHPPVNAAATMPARRESAQIGIREAQHHEIRGRLPQIGRGLGLF